MSNGKEPHAPPGPDDRVPLRVEESRVGPDHTVLRLHGELSREDAPYLGQEIVRSLRYRPRVILDMAGITAFDDLAVAAITAAHARAGSWPAVKFVAFAPEMALRAALERRSGGAIPVYASEAEAVAHLADQPALVRRTRRFAPVIDSLWQVRDFVAHAAQNWGVEPDLTEIAIICVAELSSNAVEHAGTAFAVTIDLRGQRIQLHVRDRSEGEPQLQQPSLTAPRGRGLVLVSTLAEEWGVHRVNGGGKSVWAVLARSNIDLTQGSVLPAQ